MMKPFVKTLFLVFLISCFGFAGSHAGWIENGTPLTRQWGARGGGMIARDGYSGAYIAYQVCQNGVQHIVAQRVDSLGAVLWGDEGISICMASGGQEDPAITSDGVGGAIVTWQDSRSGNGDIYAQKVNASGAVEWTADGVALCTAVGNQEIPQIIPDGEGGAIVTWYDWRSGTIDLYAQRVNASGAVEWTADGVALCTTTGSEGSCTIISDGGGGAIVAWQDFRGAESDIYAQRVNASGVVQWKADGVVLCAATGYQYYPTITSDIAGGAIVTWFDYRSESSYDIYAQRVNASGAVLWTVDGVALSTEAGDQQNTHIISDGASGAIVIWRDSRGGSMEYDIYAQRVDALGAVQWTADGVPLCAATGTQDSPAIASDGASGAIVMWSDSRGGAMEYDIYAQRVDALGTVQWATDGVPLSTATGDQYWPAIVSDDAGGAVITWKGSGVSSDIRAQRVDASGAPRWTVAGVAVCTSTGDQQIPRICADGAGGAVVTWQEQRSENFDIHAQRMNESGAIQWTASGVSLCAATGDQKNPQICSDGAGGAVVTWQDTRSGNFDIYAQRVNASGAVLWTTDGVPLCTASASQQIPAIVSDGAGGAIVTWQDTRSGNSDIYAQKVNASGAVEWAADGVPLCTATGGQYLPAIASDGAGGAIVTWEDYRLGNWRIFAQRVNASGSVEWTADGVGVCLAAGYSHTPTITSDGAGGALITWNDYRGVDNNIYAQRVNASGAFQWTTDGVPLCTATASQQSPMIVSDGAGGAVVMWQDTRGGNSDIYVQKVDASGTVEWTADGVPLCTAAGNQQYAQISSDGAGGAIVTWHDNRRGSFADIYAQSVDASGDVEWTADGVALCAATWHQQYPTIASDGGGGAIVAWQDSRCGVQVYAQRVRSSGEIVSTLLQTHAVVRAARGIRIEWSLSEMDDGARFSVLRASAPEWRFIELEGAAIEKNGLSFTCTDESCLPGSTYKYRVECGVEGAARRVLFETEAITIPALPVTLYQNHPNPFNPRTVIRFYLPEAQEIVLDVYNVAGERVARLAEGNWEKGYHEVIWDGRNGSGTVCSSGVYFSRLKAGKSTEVRKMILLR